MYSNVDVNEPYILCTGSIEKINNENYLLGSGYNIVQENIYHNLIRYCNVKIINIDNSIKGLYIITLEDRKEKIILPVDNNVGFSKEKLAKGKRATWSVPLKDSESRPVLYLSSVVKNVKRITPKDVSYPIYLIKDESGSMYCIQILNFI